MRAKRVAKWVKKHANNIARIMVVIVFLLLAVWAITLENGNLVLGYSKFAMWWTTALKSVGPELAGIVIGVVTIDYFNERRQDEQLKKQLILQMASSHNDVTDTAIRALRAYGWLYDGSLRGADLTRANLEGTDLFRANLERVLFRYANLEGASLNEANLEKANLGRANLEKANLGWANLERANLGWANLRGAFLRGANLKRATLLIANLEGAFLEEANLEGAMILPKAQLLQAESLEKATMPDGRKYEEWILDREGQVDEQALAEVESLVARETSLEEE